MTSTPVLWTFPRPHVHEGLPFANAVTGALVWGEGRRLCVTLGRVDLWDHRGGMPWTPAQSFHNLRAALEAHDEPRLRELFRATPPQAGCPEQPFTVPVGRVEFDLGAGMRLDTGSLDPKTGIGRLVIRDATNRARTVRLDFDLGRGVLCLAWPKGLAPRAKAVPAWEAVGTKLARLSYTPPALFRAAGGGGFVQTLPEDPAVAAGWRTENGISYVGAARGADAPSARAALRALFAGLLAQGGLPAVRRAAARWWRAYWADVPRLELPNPTLQRLHDFGLYKFAGLTNPAGVAATLQGPWVEDYQLPPWSNDYHFNINVQMCYWPAYHGNRLSHLLPLFRLIRSWWPQLRHNAKVFLGIDDGFMLPHAVDDRCTCMGGFWTGSVDHGCTAWIAEMMFRYVRYSGDLAFLRSDAYPFMRGAMNVYRAMMEEHDGRLSLPVSTSPEYNGAGMDAWGRDASFQLACAHRLAEDLRAAADLLGEPPDPMWDDVLARLPKASVIDRGPDGSFIGLWEGQELEASHRHHSHMAAIAPFDTIDCDDPAWARIVRNTYSNWLYRGPGLWTGWCVAWASMLHSRAGHADAAELWLEILDRFFSNDGHGTRHNVMAPGLSLMGKQPFDAPGDASGEIMQMDAGMAAVAAVYEMLAHERRGVVRLFRGTPRQWRDVSFHGLLMEGGFLLGATRRNGVVESIEVTARRAGTFRVELPWKKPGAGPSDNILSLDLSAGETVVLRP